MDNQEESKQPDVELGDKGNDEGQKRPSVLDRTMGDIEKAIANNEGEPAINEDETSLNEKQRLNAVGTIFLRLGKQLAAETNRGYQELTLQEVFDFAMPTTQPIDQ